MMSPASISTQSQCGRPSTRTSLAAGGLQVLDQPVGDGADMPVRTAGGDDHVVAERGFAGMSMVTVSSALASSRLARTTLRASAAAVRGGRSRDGSGRVRLARSGCCCQCSVPFSSLRRTADMPTRAIRRYARWHSVTFQDVARGFRRAPRSCGRGERDVRAEQRKPRPAARCRRGWRRRGSAAR